MPTDPNLLPDLFASLQQLLQNCLIWSFGTGFLCLLFWRFRV